MLKTQGNEDLHSFRTILMPGGRAVSVKLPPAAPRLRAPTSSPSAPPPPPLIARKSVVANQRVNQEIHPLPPWSAFIKADARLPAIAPGSVDLILTSPPYWKKRDYKVEKQIGQEKTAIEYVDTIVALMDQWKSVLKKTGSVFINVQDSYKGGELMEIPSLIIAGAMKAGWKLRHRIVWEKPNSTPHSASRRLAQRDEYILHFTLFRNYYSDLEGYKERFDSVSNIWRVNPSRHQGDHLAPFPDELVERVLRLACPKYVCRKCSMPFARQLEATAELNETRPQARRAMKLYAESHLTFDHIKAVQAVGISDAGKAMHYQNGAGRNGASVRLLAAEAKKVLGGYFREFTFAKKHTAGWRGCRCRRAAQPGLVYDPCAGTRTTMRVATALGLSSIGSDMKFYDK